MDYKEEWQREELLGWREDGERKFRGNEKGLAERQQLKRGSGGSFVGGVERKSSGGGQERLAGGRAGRGRGFEWNRRKCHGKTERIESEVQEISFFWKTCSHTSGHKRHLWRWPLWRDLTVTSELYMIHLSFLCLLSFLFRSRRIRTNRSLRAKTLRYLVLFWKACVDLGSRKNKEKKTWGRVSAGVHYFKVCFSGPKLSRPQPSRFLLKLPHYSAHWCAAPKNYKIFHL